MTSLSAILITVSLFVSAIAPSPCNKPETGNGAMTLVTKIAYSSSGGRSGNYEKLDISADSVVYVQARRGDEKVLQEKTANASWNGLLKTINLKDFNKIRSNPGHALYDGIDVAITIEAGGKTHSVVNGAEDAANYERVRPFTDLLEKELDAFRKKIIR